MNTWIGLDNGVSATIGIIEDGFAFHYKMPVFEMQDYTKKKKRIKRIDRKELKAIFNSHQGEKTILIERPFVNPGMFNATLSAIRAFESTLTVIEDLKIPYHVIDSKEWQRELLPAGYRGAELKKVGIEVAKRIWPSLEFKPDADGLLIAEYARRHF